jgi:hypothetical protein
MRIEAKQNLNAILESGTQRKNNNSLFDKLWYTKRIKTTMQRGELETQGFVFDGQGFIANSSMMVKVTDEDFVENLAAIQMPGSLLTKQATLSPGQGNLSARRKNSNALKHLVVKNTI